MIVLIDEKIETVEVSRMEENLLSQLKKTNLIILFSEFEVPEAIFAHPTGKPGHQPVREARVQDIGRITKDRARIASLFGREVGMFNGCEHRPPSYNEEFKTYSEYLIPEDCAWMASLPPSGEVGRGP